MGAVFLTGKEKEGGCVFLIGQFVLDSNYNTDQQMVIVEKRQKESNMLE